MTDYVKSNQIERMIGRGGLPLIRLSHASGYAAVISEYGAHTLSWTSPEEKELLFVSKAALYQEGKAIRGGIPVVFPQFGKGPLPPHGFARTRRWKVVREQVSTNDAVSVTLRLGSDRETEALWPHAFVLELDLVLTDVLLIALRVQNSGVAPFWFTSAFHTYFRTEDISQVAVKGLHKTTYLDLLKNREVKQEERVDVLIPEAVDRVYTQSPEMLSVVSKADGIRYVITKEGLSDTVMWNPWSEGAKILPDLEAEEYRHMLCVESANVLTPITVQPGALHTSAQILRVQPI